MDVVFSYDFFFLLCNSNEINVPLLNMLGRDKTKENQKLCSLLMKQMYLGVLAVGEGLISVVLDWIIKTEKSNLNERQHWYMWTSY